MLAFHDGNLLEEVIQNGLKPFAKNTITNLMNLEQQSIKSKLKAMLSVQKN